MFIKQSFYLLCNLCLDLRPEEEKNLPAGGNLTGSQPADVGLETDPENRGHNLDNIQQPELLSEIPQQPQQPSDPPLPCEVSKEEGKDKKEEKEELPDDNQEEKVVTTTKG